MASDLLPIGAIVMWGGNNNVPLGWQLCDGTILEKADYPELYNVIADSFGDSDKSGIFDPSFQFFLPDLRGRFIRGVDDGSGNDPDVDKRKDLQSDKDKRGVGSIQKSQNLKHSHKYSHLDSDSANTKKGYVSVKFNGNYGLGDHYISSMDSGGSESRPVNVSLYYIIKAK